MIPAPLVLWSAVVYAPWFLAAECMIAARNWELALTGALHDR